MSAFQLADVTWDHVDRLILAGWDEFDATRLAFAALARVPLPPFCPVGVAPSLRPRPAMPRPS